MRYVFSVLAVLMLLAVAVQYNDPDGPLWMVYYGVPAAWCLLAAVKPQLFANVPVRVFLAASVVVWAVLAIVYWPPVTGFWHEEVWEMGKTDMQAAAIAEQAREGMGLMIATAVLIVVGVWAFAKPPRSSSESRLTA
jgi:hypothetical protein